MDKPGRNDPCPCGSGKQWKRCHWPIVVGPSAVQLAPGEAPPPGSELVAYNIKLMAAHGRAGVDDDQDNPLARALRNLMNEGQNITAVAHSVVSLHGDLRWLGVFALTAASRIVFFPGFVEPFDRISRTSSDPNADFDIGFQIDHVTLEPDRRSWHLTKRTRKNAQRTGGPTLDVGHGRHVWFGLTTSQPHELRPLFSSTVARAPAPKNNVELKRRISVFQRAVALSAAADLNLGPRLEVASSLHVIATVAAPSAPLYDGPVLCTPPTLAPSVVEARSGAVQLGPDVQIQLLAAWVPGTVAPGFTISAP